MLSKEKLKSILIGNLDDIMRSLNASLRGDGLDGIKSILSRLGRGQKLPYWFEGLQIQGKLPNFDGKTIGSILEMLFVAIVEKKIKLDLGYAIDPLKINPARGVDLPDFDLGIKSPSKNFCTSEPFFTAYERLYGSEFDALILLTDYQEAKKKKELSLQVVNWKYLRKTEIADIKLCRIALKHRAWLLEDDEQRAQKFFRFLAYVNQSDWRATKILKLMDELNNESKIKEIVEISIAEFKLKNRQLELASSVLLPDTELRALKKVLEVSPLYVGVIEAAESWVLEVLKETARAPSSSEWNQLKSGPLDGKIGMSFALQWRYNFSAVFKSGNEIGIDSEIKVPGEIDLDGEGN